MLKRAFDIAFAAGTLIVLLPLLVAVAVWVKLDSPGPLFFRQVRVGFKGREFKILKFRTMHARDNSGPLVTVAADPRITRAGAALRRYKIDEFPQFVNVLLGDMSIVGPRPEVPRYVALYPPAIREEVLSVRPGITDCASIEFRDESEILAGRADPERAYIEDVLPVKLEYCRRYVRERSFRGDLEIIRRSFQAAFGRRAVRADANGT